MLAKDEAALRGLRAIKSALLLARTEKSGHEEISPDSEIKLLQKLVKQRKDSIEIYQQQNRADLAKTEIEEVEVIERYLPQQMSEDKVREELKNIITTTGATSPADLGKVMGAASKHFAGMADNKIISRLAKELLMG
jgi:uncharacterized protein